MNVTYVNGTAEQRATFLAVIDDSAYNQWTFMDDQIEVEWVTEPQAPSLKLHNVYAYTQNGLARNDGGESGTRSLMQLRPDICGTADIRLSYDVVHHELGHAVIGNLVDALGPEIETRLLAVFRGADGRQPTEADWEVHGGSWGQSVLEAACETFKDVFSAKRRWDNRTIWKLQRELLPTFCQVFRFPDTSGATEDHLIRQVAPDLFGPGSIHEYFTLPESFGLILSVDHDDLPVTFDYDMTWPNPYSGTIGDVGPPPWPTFPTLGPFGGVLADTSTGLAVTWWDQTPNLGNVGILGGEIVAAEFAVGSRSINPPDGTTYMSVKIFMDIKFFEWFYPTPTAPTFPAYSHPPYPQIGGALPSWDVTIGRPVANPGEPVDCPGWPYHLGSLTVGDAPPAKAESPAAHGSVTDAIAIR